MTGEAMAAWVAKSRAASNVPPKVEDRGVLAQVAALLLAARRLREGGGDGRAA